MESPEVQQLGTLAELFAAAIMDCKPNAALIFEHAGVDRRLENALSMVAPGGALSVILQIPSETEHGVSSGRFPSIQNLALTSHSSTQDGSKKRLLDGNFV